MVVIGLRPMTILLWDCRFGQYRTQIRILDRGLSGQKEAIAWEGQRYEGLTTPAIVPWKGYLISSRHDSNRLKFMDLDKIARIQVSAWSNLRPWKELHKRGERVYQEDFLISTYLLDLLYDDRISKNKKNGPIEDRKELVWFIPRVAKITMGTLPSTTWIWPSKMGRIARLIVQQAGKSLTIKSLVSVITQALGRLKWTVKPPITIGLRSRSVMWRIRRIFSCVSQPMNSGS